MHRGAVDDMLDATCEVGMINYDTMGIEEFDAVVTGELTHYALHMEHHLEKCITQFFGVRRADDFFRIVLRRDGLTFQDKIEIVRAFEPLAPRAAGLGKVLKEVEEFKALRNSAAHGRDDGSVQSPLKLVFGSVSRSGKEKLVEITPKSHRAFLLQADDLLERLARVTDLVSPCSKGTVLD